MWKNDRFFQERKKKFTPRIAAALLKDGKVSPITKKSLLKHFPAAANYINRYLEEQKPDLDNVEQMRNFVNLIYANF